MQHVGGGARGADRIYGDEARKFRRDGLDSPDALVGERYIRFLVLMGEFIAGDRAKEMVDLITKWSQRDQLIATPMKWTAASVAMNALRAETITKVLLEKFSTQAAS